MELHNGDTQPTTKKGAEEDASAKSVIPPEIQKKLEVYLTTVSGPVSKNHKKKMIREFILDSKRDELRAEKREKRRRSMANKRALGIKKPKPIVQANQGLKIILDLSFFDKMTSKELLSTAAQCQHSYAETRRHEIGTELVLTSVEDNFRENLARKCPDYNNWKVQISPLYFMDYLTIGHSKVVDGGEPLPLPKMCYLTADSENDITSIDADTYYVIGALVDHNRYPGLCYEKAKQLGIPHGRLPLAKYIKFSSRKVLTINQVVGILASMANTGDWEKAILSSFPTRKRPILIKDQE